jgi:hypothetical protein
LAAATLSIDTAFSSHFHLSHCHYQSHHHFCSRQKLPCNHNFLPICQVIRRQGGYIPWGMAFLCGVDVQFGYIMAFLCGVGVQFGYIMVGVFADPDESFQLVMPGR